MALLPAVTAGLLHYSAMDTGLTAGFLVQGRGEMALQPAVIAVLFRHSAMDTGTDGSVDSTG